MLRQIQHQNNNLFYRPLKICASSVSHFPVLPYSTTRPTSLPSFITIIVGTFVILKASAMLPNVFLVLSTAYKLMLFSAIPLTSCNLKNFGRIRDYKHTTSLSYNLPMANSKISGVRVFIVGQNLMTFTGYTGQDPEVNTSKAINGIPSFGIDYTSYPAARTVSFGASVTF